MGTIHSGRDRPISMYGASKLKAEMANSAFLFAFCVRPTFDSKRADVGRSVMACHLAISAPIGTISTKDNPVGFLLFRQARVGHARFARFGPPSRDQARARRRTPRKRTTGNCARKFYSLSCRPGVISARILTHRHLSKTSDPSQ